MYVKQEDGRWWKIQEHQATEVSGLSGRLKRADIKVDFSAIKNDRTGLFMEGGPYILWVSTACPQYPCTTNDKALFETRT
jgi:hypothetical protein